MENFVFNVHKTLQNLYELWIDRSGSIFSFHLGYSKNQLQAIPREQSTPMLDKAIKLFSVSNSKLSNIKKMEELIRPRVVRPVSTSAESIDKKLGFDHKVVAPAKSVELSAPKLALNVTTAN